MYVGGVLAMSQSVKENKTRKTSSVKTASKAKKGSVKKKVSTKSGDSLSPEAELPVVKSTKKRESKKTKLDSEAKTMKKKSSSLEAGEVAVGNVKEEKSPKKLVKDEETIFEKFGSDSEDIKVSDDDVTSSSVKGKEADLLEEENYNSSNSSNESENIVSVKLSKALLRKINSQAEDEGISVEDYLTELLSEGVVLRAWEIVERKNQMRNQVHNQSGNNRNNNNNNNGGRHHHNQRKGLNHRGNGMSHGRYQSIMDDKATFLEYVRSQERGRR